MKNQTKKNHPIDAVILWVDGSDEAYFNKMLPFVEDQRLVKTKNFRTRFDQVEEIQFTVDSILKNASFIRNIYIITDNQVPSFLKNKNSLENYSNVSIIDHQVIFEDQQQHLPTFNCRPIETKIYKTPNLSEHFIYFNDDMFLINKTNPSDFFIDGLPVLRGKWLLFEEDRFTKKIKSFFKGKDKKRKAGHKIAQQKGAKLTGFNNYYKFHHTPYPLRKSTFTNYFEKNKETEIENIKHKFRHHNQFTPQGLINHVEIKAGTCILKNNYELLYFQSYKKPLLWYKLNLKYFTNRKRKLFMCMQSLDQCPPNKLNFFKNWLSKKIE